jgi:hypothetical protein
MSKIFTDSAFDLGFDIDNESLIPIFTNNINSFASEKNLDPACIENYIKVGGNLLDACCAYHYGNGDLMYEQFGESAGIYACKENDNRFLEMLQKYNYNNFNGILHKAVSLNAINQVKWLLNLPNIDVNSFGHRGKTPLYYAIRNKSIELVKLLLENGTNPNLKYAMCQNTYLDLAIDCYENDIEYNKTQESKLEKDIEDIKDLKDIINLLLEYGAVTNNQKWPLDTKNKPVKTW